MTLQELYTRIDGNYDHAVQIMRMEKLISRYVLKFPGSDLNGSLMAAAESMDPTQLFERAHAMKGVCANLGLTRLSDAASEIAEEFRPGNSRSMTDDEVKAKLSCIAELYARTTEGIRQYTGA